MEKSACDDPVEIDLKRNFFVGRYHRLGYTQSTFRDRDSVFDEVYTVSRREKRERDLRKFGVALPAALFRAVSPNFDHFFSERLVLHFGKKFAESLFKFFFHFFLLFYNEISESSADIWLANFTGFFGVIPSIRSAWS